MRLRKIKCEVITYRGITVDFLVGIYSNKNSSSVRLFDYRWLIKENCIDPPANHNFHIITQHSNEIFT